MKNQLHKRLETYKMQEWRKRSFPPVGRRKTSPENTPRSPAELKEQGKAKKKVLWSWRKENNMRNYKKNPNFSSPAGQRRRKSQSRRRKSRRSRRSSTSFKDSRKITKRTKEPSPTSNTLPSPEYLLSPEKSPEIAGRTEMGGEA